MFYLRRFVAGKHLNLYPDRNLKLAVTYGKHSQVIACIAVIGLPGAAAVKGFIEDVEQGIIVGVDNGLFKVNGLRLFDGNSFLGGKRGLISVLDDQQKLLNGLFRPISGGDFYLVLSGVIESGLPFSILIQRS